MLPKYTPIASAVFYALFTPSAWAAETSLSVDDSVTQMSSIIVTAEVNKNDVGKQVYTKAQLENTPNSQKTITDFLKVNPNVQFGNSALAAGTQANLNASNVSINGAMFYENKFLLNNVNIGNSLNPVAGGSDAGYTAIAGQSLATTVNTDLICELEVLDSNVSAEYGGFTGGVIKAKTCSPKTPVGKVHGSLSYDYTSSDWAKLNYVTEDEQENFENELDSNYQKNYTKQGISSTVYGRPTEKLGLSLSTSRRWSDIALNMDTAEQQNKNQKRQSDNFAGNAYYDFNDNNKLKFGLYLQNDDDEKFVPNLLNSDYQSQGEDLAFETELETKYKNAKITQSLVLQKQSLTKDSINAYLLNWNKSTNKNWGKAANSSEGGYGDLETSLNNWQYDIKSVFDQVHSGGISHQLKIGAGYAHSEAEWQRSGDVTSYYTPIKSTGGLGISSCTRDDGTVDVLCDLSYASAATKGQYFNRRYIYQAGGTDVQQDRWYAFLENEINWENKLSIRLGLRHDYDSLTKQNNLAPRSHLEYLPFADDRLKLVAGWNRYYANKAFDYELQDGVNALTIEQKRTSINADWLTTNAQAITSNTKRNQLDTPYTDEAVFAIQGELGNWASQLKYVNRDNKEQIRKRFISNNPVITEYDNYGVSKADIYTLAFSNIQPIEVLGSKNQFRFAVDYTDITRNFNDYNDNAYNILNYEPYIVYNGTIIAEGDRPANNFAQPLTLRLGWDIAFSALPLKISNLFRYRSPYDSAVKYTIPTANRPLNQFGDEIKTQYREEKLGSRFNWDLRASYDLSLSNRNNLILGVTVNNLTNKKNTYTGDENGTLLSESGRQFIADLTYKF